MQEETMVLPMLEQVEVDILISNRLRLWRRLREDRPNRVSPSFQLYITPELVRVFEAAPSHSASFNDQLFSPDISFSDS